MDAGSVVVALSLGFAAGLTSGMLGVGGGVLFVPALVLFLDQSQLDAQATSLLAVIVVVLVGAWRQRRYGNVRLRDGLTIGLLAPVGAGAGTLLANAVSERALEIGFALLSLAVAGQLVRRVLSEPSDPPPADRR